MVLISGKQKRGSRRLGNSSIRGRDRSWTRTSDAGGAAERRKMGRLKLAWHPEILLSPGPGDLLPATVSPPGRSAMAITYEVGGSPGPESAPELSIRKGLPVSHPRKLDENWLRSECGPPPPVYHLGFRSGRFSQCRQCHRPFASPSPIAPFLAGRCRQSF